MNLRGLAYLAIRVLAIYVFILGIRQAVTLANAAIPTYMQITDLKIAQVYVIIGIPTLLLWIVGVLLWRSADRWSNRLVPAANGSPEPLERHADIESFVLSVVGLVLVILAAVNLIQSVLSFIWITNQEVHFDRQGYYFQFAGHAVEIVMGAVLLLKSNGIAALLRKIRQA